MKNIMLLMIACVWLHKTTAQSHTGMDQYYTMHGNSFSFTPMIWYQAKKGFCAEGRYNYEAPGAYALYAGKTFEFKSPVEYSFSTLAGVVMGKFKGGSVAFNADVAYKKISFSLQSQYTFSVQDKAMDFIYVWADMSYRLLPWLSAGLSIQQTSVCKTTVSDKGIFVKFQHRSWAFPVYFFNPVDNKHYLVMGINYEWN
jgi:hypothetical protein